VKVAVVYESDPDQVRDVLCELAHAHPQVVQSPPPGAFLVSLGEKALEFELRCVVADVEKSLSVKSDLHCAILNHFREAAIEIPYPQTELRIRQGSLHIDTDDGVHLRDQSDTPADS
jgi:small-conductance mechanosensitive channel